jgi:MFS family permease
MHSRYYAPSIFQRSVGLSHNLSLLLAGFNGVAYFLSSLPPIWILDRLGRRKLMLFACIGMCSCMAGRDRVEREQSFRYRCFRNALPVQLLLRSGHASNPVAFAFRIRSAGDPDSGGGSGFCFELDIHISCRSDHAS